MIDFTGYHEDDLPAGWRDYDDRDEYRSQIAADLASELRATSEVSAW